MIKVLMSIVTVKTSTSNVFRLKMKDGRNLRTTEKFTRIDKLNICLIQIDDPKCGL